MHLSPFSFWWECLITTAPSSAFPERVSSIISWDSSRISSVVSDAMPLTAQNFCVKSACNMWFYSYRHFREGQLRLPLPRLLRAQVRGELRAAVQQGLLPRGQFVSREEISISIKSERLIGEAKLQKRSISQKRSDNQSIAFLCWKRWRSRNILVIVLHNLWSESLLLVKAELRINHNCKNSKSYKNFLERHRSSSIFWKLLDFHQ